MSAGSLEKHLFKSEFFSPTSSARLEHLYAR
jgi:hypothetical protein